MIYGKVEMENTLKKEMPLVSIVIPVYNGSNYLGQAINSALAQTYKNIEILVINDGSTDDGVTERIAKAYGSQIRYYVKENGGVATALNFGIQKMRGEYFSWLSHDDMYTPDKIQSEVNKIAEVGEAVIACNVQVVASDGTLIQKNKLSDKVKKSVKCFLPLDSETGLNGCSLLVPKKYFEKCGNFNPQLKCTQDYDMWFRIAEKYPFAFVDTYGVLSRQHQAQDSKTKIELCTQEADRLHSRFLRKTSVKEMQEFVENDIKYLYTQYYVYKNAGYLKTASQIARHLYNIENGDFFKEILKEISGFGNENVNFNMFQKGLKEAREKKGNKKTLLFYSNVWTKGGIERVLSILLPYFTDEYQVILVSNYIENEEGFALPDDVIHIKVDKSLNEKLPYNLLVLAVLLKADIFIGNPNIIYSFLNVYELMEESGIRTIACNHGYYFIPYWAEWLYPVAKKRKEVYPKASAVTWLTDFSAMLGSMWIDQCNTVVMPNPNTFSPQGAKQNLKGNKNIVVVGRFYDDIKRVDRALKVFREVLRKHEDAKLYLVGDYDLNMHVPVGSPYTIADIIEQLKFPNINSVIWVGDTDDVVKYYQIASVLMLTSNNEGFPMVLNEAGTFGVPQVIFDIPGLEDIVSEGKNGFIVPQDDIIGMAEKICVLFDNPEKLQEMSIAAQKKACYYDAPYVADKWKKLFVILLEAGEKTSERIKQEFPISKIESVEQLKRVVSYYEKQVEAITKENYKIPPVAEIHTEHNVQAIQQQVSALEPNIYNQYL